MFKKSMLTATVITLCATQLSAHEYSSRPDFHAPIGVMGDHNHKKGEWMTSYRYSTMKMKGNRDGTSDMKPSEVLNNFMVAPTDMSMEMHMFGLMYGATDDLTIMAMVPYVRKSMNHITKMGQTFKTKTNGIGDIKLGGIYNIFSSHDKEENISQNIKLNFGFSLPTGSIDERGDTPAMNNAKLPYPMQLGSGTFDPILGVTYVSAYDSWSLGGQAITNLRFGKNNEGYRLGNEYNATIWGAKELNKYSSISLRLDGKIWNNIKGEDTDLNPMMVPTARTDLRGGKRIDALVGLNLLAPEGKIAGNRLAIEFGMPIYENLDGPQLKTDYRLTVGWQYSF